MTTTTLGGALMARLRVVGGPGPAQGDELIGEPAAPAPRRERTQRVDSAKPGAVKPPWHDEPQRDRGHVQRFHCQARLSEEGEEGPPREEPHVGLVQNAAIGIVEATDE